MNGKSRIFFSLFIIVIIFSVAACNAESKNQARLSSKDKAASELVPEEHKFKNETLQDSVMLTAQGSTEPANTIFTNPGPDCSTSIDISWVTPRGILCRIEVIDKNDPNTYIFDYEDKDSCFPTDENQPVELKAKDAPKGTILQVDTLDNIFNDIRSKLADNKNVVETHRFEKHGYRLSNLKPNTDYSYRIVSYNPATGEKKHSETRHFRTAGASAWKAAVLGDFHHYSPEPHRLESAMGMLSVLDSVAGGISWVLSTGDECAWGGSLNFWTELSEQPGFKNFMWAPVEGNHDSMDEDKDKTDSFFEDSHYFPHNGYPGQQGASYWFRYGEVLFIMLNNEGMLKAGSVAPAVKWMEEVISANPAKYIVVVEHHQWLVGTDGTNGQLDRWYKEFDRMGVDLAISGHNHAYLRTFPLYDRQPVESGKGTVYVVNASSDNERGRPLKTITANHDLIAQRWSEGKHTVGGMVMDVNPQRIVMTLYDRYGKPRDSFSVPSRR